MLLITAIFLLGWFVGNYQGKTAVRQGKEIFFKEKE